MVTKQPADQSHFILPDLGEGVHEAELIRWCVTPGESVAEHQTLAEMETDKALVEVPSPWEGVVKDLNGKEGDIIDVGAILVTYDIGGSAAPAAGSAASAAATATVEETAGGEGEREDAGTVVGSVDDSLSVPSSFVRRGAEVPAVPSRAKALATPAVRRIAREHGIEIDRVPGTGRGGRVTATDVHGFTAGGGTGVAPAAAPAAVAPAVPATAVAAVHAERPVATGTVVEAPPTNENLPVAAKVALPLEGVAERVPFRGVRRKIAQALRNSVDTLVHFTVVDEADVTALDRKRQGYEQLLGRKLSMLPMVMSAVTKALRHHPALNANVDDFMEEIHVKSVINLGCAVDTDHGLMVPVIENADQLSIVQLGDAVREAALACRKRTIPREQLTGGTFTISNVGSYGGMFATPIINYPEVAILAAGRAKERVLTRDGAFYAGLVLPLSLSCDHRVVDGAEGARFLHTVVKLLENPDELLPAV